MGAHEEKDKVVAKLLTARNRNTVLKDASIIQALKNPQKGPQVLETWCCFKKGYTRAHYV